MQGKEKKGNDSKHARKKIRVTKIHRKKPTRIMQREAPVMQMHLTSANRIPWYCNYWTRRTVLGEQRDTSESNSKLLQSYHLTTYSKTSTKKSSEHVAAEAKAFRLEGGIHSLKNSGPSSPMIWTAEFCFQTMDGASLPNSTASQSERFGFLRRLLRLFRLNCTYQWCA